MIIAPYSAEIENIVSCIQAQTQRCISFTSATANEGVSTITHSIAQRLLLSGYSVLLIDLNANSPAVEHVLNADISKPLRRSDTHSDIGAPDLISPIGEQCIFTGMTLHGGKTQLANLRQPGALEDVFQSWAPKFDYILIDSPAVLNNDQLELPAEYIAKACGASILITLSNITTESLLKQAYKRLEAQGVNLLGLVVNDKMNPSLKDELKRQIDKFRRLFPTRFSTYTKQLNQWLDHTAFFSIDD
ncbi:hypothetical protein [Agaribacterium sp. ZY112]|uniref:hypothetical protein n=1 Tax=Agaribacterium sp. ZY112 TaxID=3233574 RepID=UPI003526A3E0